MKDLVVLLGSRRAGVVTYANDRLSFVYDAAWRTDTDAYPLSLSMPLTAAEHSNAVVRPFIWNLLPDNERTLDRWARQFHVSARNPFALIAQVGQDCAGAVQFVPPARAEQLIIAGPGSGTIDWLDDAAIGARLRSVLADATNGRTAGDNGQFSLAGAQPKTALLFDDGRWGVPSGRIPTTHILKPPARDMPGHAENEHFCLNLARAIGLRAARSEVRTFDGQPTIVVTRYDRIKAGSDGVDGWMRLHQEDMCQAFGIAPDGKYQNDGGPSAERIVRLLRDVASDPERDIAAFTDALIFNWLIAGTDAHAKNYSMLIGGEGTVVLAPLYDIASAHGIAELQRQRMKLAMKIEYYLVERVLPHHWARWAKTAGLEGDAMVARVFAMAQALPDAIARVAVQMRGEGLDHPVVQRLEVVLTERARAIAAM